MLGQEQIYNPNFSFVERLYIRVFGMPVIGLRIRGRNVFSLIPQDREFSTILDAGSGPGVFTFELARRYPLAQVLGIDMLPEPLDSCKTIAEKAGVDNVTFEKNTIEELSKKNGRYDLVLCIDILEHINDDETALKSLRKLLTPNGILLLHVPALYRRYPVWRKQLNFDVESHVRPGYELEEIQQKVEKAGLKIIISGYTYGFWETLANNFSYMITHARMENKLIYALAFPFLNMLSLLGARARPKTLGAGIYLVAAKNDFSNQA